MTDNQSNISSPLKTGLILVTVISGLVFVCYTAQILLVFFAAIFISVFFCGLSRVLQTRTGLTYFRSLAIVLLYIFSSLAIIALLIGPAIVEQSTNLADALPKAQQQLTSELQKSAWGAHFLDVANQAIHLSPADSWKGILRFGGLTVDGVSGLFFAIILAFFIALQPQLYRNGILALFSADRRDRANQVLEELSFTLWWWLMGQLITMASVGLLVGCGLMIMGVPLAGPLGLIAAFLSFIPSLGPFISVIPALLLAFTVSPQMALYVGVLYMAVQLLESNVISPFVQLRSISLPPACILGAELVMGLLLGGSGLAMATPLCAATLVLINMLYIQDVLGEEGSLPSQKKK